MKHQSEKEFQKIAEAIGYITENFKQQPSLEDIARHVHMSPYHFQRMFTKWAGTSPKNFVRFLNVEYARELLGRNNASVLEASVKTGLSSSGRLHDLFIKIYGMTPGEYKNGGENLTLKYSFADSPFGRAIIASTDKGVAYMAFITNEATAFSELRTKFPHARFVKKADSLQRAVLAFFTGGKNISDIKLHLKGTDFQLKVWEALLKIPAGRVSTYAAIAKNIGALKAHRAVGSAVGKNPVAFLIPCHRVIQASGALGDYHWGSSRKAAMIGWEGARSDSSGRS